MKRKRFVKLMMAAGNDRNDVNKLADMYKGESRERLISDFKFFDKLLKDYAIHDVTETTNAFFKHQALHFARGNGKSLRRFLE